MESDGPRVCVPIALPDRNGQTYAVLQLLGFSHQPVSTAPQKLIPVAFHSEGTSQPHFKIRQQGPSFDYFFRPPTPPSVSGSQAQVIPCVESIGSDAASSTSEDCKKGDLRSRDKSIRSPSCVNAAVMKKAGAGGGGFANVSPSLSSPSSSRMQPQSPSGVGPGSIPNVASHHDREKEQHFTSTTTFVQVDTSSFRELVQKLTGASDTDGEKLPITLPSRQASRSLESSGPHKLVDNTFGGMIPKPVGDLGARRSSFKLHERRQSNLRKLEVKGLGPAAAFRRGNAGYGGLASPTSGEGLSPKHLKFPALVPSPVTPLDVFENPYAPTTPTTYEGYTGLKPSPRDFDERREKDAHFFLHPSPTFERPRPQPELLTLFPLTSPRASEPS